MFAPRNRVIYTLLLACLILLTACNATPTGETQQATLTLRPIATPLVITPTVVPVMPVPQRYSAHIVLRGSVRPDDLTFDQQGRLLYSDAHNGTVNRVNADGTVTVLLRGMAAPEGLVVLADNTLIIAEQRYNRILALAAGAATPTVLRVLPGIPSTAGCKDGVDGIAFDQTTQTLIVPDSPTGVVYRMSLDGKTLTPLVSGIARPVGATVDGQGNIYVADECGGALWRIAPDGKTMRYTGFGMLDDVVLDQHGNALVIDLQPNIHALIRINLATGQRTILAQDGFIEPQGLVIAPIAQSAKNDTIWVSDDYANMIMEYKPA